MRKLLLFLAVLAVAPFACAQDASLTTPITRPSETKIVIKRLDITASQAVIEVWFRDNADADIRQVNYVIPDSNHATATVGGLFTAIDTARSGETGGVLRRANFRVLGYLLDEGYLPPCTLNP